jgi:hypothetical protein
MRKLILLSFMFLLASGIYSQSRNYTASRTEVEPEIDGLLDEKVWDISEWSGNFTQHSPYDDRKPSQQTKFKLIYNDNYIFVLIFSEDEKSDLINKRLSRRDEMEGDYVGVHFDTYNDNRTAFAFFVSASGVKSDLIYTNDGDEENLEWNPIWHVKTSVNSEGWIAEMKIPISQLRFSKEENKNWGFQVSRYIFRYEEQSLWQAFPLNEHGWVQHFGLLKGVSNLKPQKQFELIPYALLGLERSEVDKSNPFSKSPKLINNFGLDGKVGITNDFILDFTINPDFGQIEADPSVVNLTAFETYFHEKRPFFIEGQSITEFSVSGGENKLFYSRRIGGRPNYKPTLENDEYIEMPQNTDIIAAVKLTGKTKEGLSVGIIESLTANKFAKISDGENNRKVKVEPLTNYFLARVQQDFNGGESQFGGIITSTNRFFDEAHLDFMPKSAVTSGLNYKKYWQNKKYYFINRLAFSHVYGSETAISNLQTQSQRFFQRPDADYVELDNSRTSLSGTSAATMIGKQGANGFNFGLNLSYISPEFETNDLGYLRLADKYSESIWLRYKTKKPANFYRYINFSLSQWSGFDFGWRKTYLGGDISSSIQFNNYWNLNAGFGVEDQDFNNYLLRGGSGIYTPGGFRYWAGISSNKTKDFVFEFDFSASDYNDYKNSNSFDFSIKSQPFNALSIAINTSYTFDNNNLQFVDIEYVDDSKKYLFASINQHTYSINLNLNYSITPDLSIQLYAAPFISNGHYIDYKEITNPTASQFFDRFNQYSEYAYWRDMKNSNVEFDDNNNGAVDFIIRNPDFNLKEFNSNLVLRWEFKPGSVVYLVWSEYRINTQNIYEYRLLKNYNEMFKTFPNDVFMIKFTYNIQVNKNS